MSELERIRPFYPLIKSLYKASRGELGFEPHPTIHVSNNQDNSKNPLGKTAHYSPSEHKIVLYTTGRHIKDILRSLSHELVHHNQNCRGEFDNGAATVQGYAQEDGHLREMEREAYDNGNMIFRDWEDQMKKKNGKSLFTTSSNYVRPMTIDVGGGRIVEGDKEMNNKIIESKLREMIKSVMQEMIDDDLDGSVNELEAVQEECGEYSQMAADTAEDAPLVVTTMEEELDEEKMTGPSSEACKNAKDAMEADYYCNESLNESFLPKGRDIRSAAREMTYDKLLKKWAK